MFRSSSPLFSPFFRSAVRRSGGAAKPGWHVGKGQRWGPEIPDKQYFWDHPTYTGFVLWLRGVRPYLEKLGGDGFSTARYLLVDCIVNPVKNVVVRHNQDFRHQVVAFVAFYFTAQSINMSLNRYYQYIMDLKHLKSLEEAAALQESGFFLSESEDLQQRAHNYSTHHERLNALWESAFVEASDFEDVDEGFSKLCGRLEIVDKDHHPATVPSPMTWRFNMIPYGAGSEDSKTFPVPGHEEPHRAFALNFTYNNLGYNWGDYVERLDNKGGPMRPARQMFTDVYIPPTK